MPDEVCSDLSWPGLCLENLSADRLGPAAGPPLLVHTSGPQNSHLALLRPLLPSPSASGDDNRRGGGGGGGRGKGCRDGTAAAKRRVVHEEETSESSAVEPKDRLALHAGPIRQISAVVPRANAPPRVFARCEYSATLVRACKVVDRLYQMGETGLAAGKRIRRSKVAAGVPVAADVAGKGGAAARVGQRVGNNSGDREQGQGGEEEEEGFDFDGFEEVEKLVFARRLTCTACSPFTPSHAAFLDEEFRLFHWHADRGAVTHGSGPLPIDTPPGAAVGFPRSEAEDRRRRNADVALDYGSHPRVLWIAGRHRAYRIDLREKPSPAALAPALDPGVYFKNFKDDQIIDGGPGRVGGRGKAPKIRSLVVGRRSVYDVFVAAGLHLACMDVRFPTDVVARWDLPQEVDQLRWLPGVPGEGADAKGAWRVVHRRNSCYCWLWNWGLQRIRLKAPPIFSGTLYASKTRAQGVCIRFIVFSCSVTRGSMASGRTEALGAHGRRGVPDACFIDACCCSLRDYPGVRAAVSWFLREHVGDRRPGMEGMPGAAGARRHISGCIGERGKRECIPTDRPRDTCRPPSLFFVWGTCYVQ